MHQNNKLMLSDARKIEFHLDLNRKLTSSRKVGDQETESSARKEMETFLKRDLG